MNNLDFIIDNVIEKFKNQSHYQFMNEGLSYLNAVEKSTSFGNKENIEEDFQKCMEGCQKVENSKQKQICETMCYLKGYNEVLNSLRKGLSRCSDRNNPETCRDNLNEKIKKVTEKLNKKQEKISKYREELEKQKEKE